MEIRRVVWRNRSLTGGAAAWEGRAKWSAEYALSRLSVFRLTHHVPPRLWREAMSLAGAPTGMS